MHFVRGRWLKKKGGKCFTCSLVVPYLLSITAIMILSFLISNAKLVYILEELDKLINQKNLILGTCIKEINGNW